MDLYLAAPADPHFQRMLKEVSGQWTVADWSPDESRVVVEEFLSINESYLHLIDIATGATTTITPRRTDPKAQPVSVSRPRWSKDGRSIYYLSDKGSEFRHLVQHDLVTGSETVFRGLPDIPWDIEEFDQSDDGRLIAVIANQDGLDVLHVFDAATNREEPLPRLAPGQLSGLKFRADSHELGFTRSSAQESSDAYSWISTRSMGNPALVLIPSAGPRARPAGWTSWRSPNPR